MPTFRKNIALWFLLAVIITACTTIKYVPVVQKETVTVRDSVYLKDTVLKVEVEKARISDFVGLLDTLSIETEISRFRAYCDTTAGVLRGDVRQSGKVPVQIQYKERIVYRDSIRDRDVPVPVEVVKEVKVVPWFWRFFSVIGIVALAGAVFWLLRKFHVL